MARILRGRVMWWTKIPDEDLIGMLEAMPSQWPEAAIRDWLRLVDRCCSEGRGYWLPGTASPRMIARSQNCKPAGAAAVSALTGCSRNVAARLIRTTMQRQERKDHKQAQGGHKGGTSYTKTSASTDRGGAQAGTRGSQGGHKLVESIDHHW